MNERSLQMLFLWPRPQNFWVSRHRRQQWPWGNRRCEGAVRGTPRASFWTLARNAPPSQREHWEHK